LRKSLNHLKRSWITNDKLNLLRDNILGIVLAALAAGLCAAIDYLIGEELNQ